MMITTEMKMMKMKTKKKVMIKQLFIDLETTGLNPKTDSITEFGYIYKVGGKIKKQGVIKVPNGVNIYPSIINLIDGFVDKFNKEDKMYFIAYNAEFDTNFMRELFTQNNNNFFGSYFYNPSVCIMQMVANKLMRKNVRPENFKLSTICKYYKVPVDETKLHSALYDIKISNEVYKAVRKK